MPKRLLEVMKDARQLPSRISALCNADEKMLKNGAKTTRGSTHTRAEAIIRKLPVLLLSSFVITPMRKKTLSKPPFIFDLHGTPLLLAISRG